MKDKLLVAHIANKVHEEQEAERPRKKPVKRTKHETTPFEEYDGCLVACILIAIWLVYSLLQ